jgi:hypothetical protein
MATNKTTVIRELRSLQRTLLKRLVQIEREHRELTDTMTREALWASLRDGFVKPEPAFVRPGRAWMYSRAGEIAVRSALSRFIESARRLADAAGIAELPARLELLYGGRAVRHNGKTLASYVGVPTDRELIKLSRS